MRSDSTSLAGTQEYRGSQLNATLTPQSTTSVFRRDNSNLLKSTLKHAVTSDPALAKNPRTTMSQLRLFELSQSTTSEDIDKLGLEELRNGFFDPIYIKPKRPGSSNNEINGQQKTDSSKFSFKVWAKELIDCYYESRKESSKFFIAYFIAMVLCLIHKPGNWFGKYRVFLPISTLINHPVHSVGSQLEITIFSAVGLALGLGWSSLALYISTSTQPTRNHQGGILAGSMFLGLIIMAWMKAFWLRLYHLFLTSGFVLIFLSTNLDLNSESVMWKNTWDIGIPYLFGLLISLVVSAVWFPDVGHQKMMNTILGSIDSIRETIKEFAENPITDNVSRSEKILKLQKNLTYSSLMLSEEFREFLSELKVCVLEQEDLKKIRNHLNFTIGPLRAIPTPTYFTMKENDEIWSMSNNNTDTYTSYQASGIATPLPKNGIPQITQNHNNVNSTKNNKLIYISVVNDAFSESLFKLLFEMLDNLDMLQSSLEATGGVNGKFRKNRFEAISLLERSMKNLKKRVYQLDVAYKKFTKSDYFYRDLLQEEAVGNMFLFLRYARQCAVNLIGLSDVVASSCQKSKGWRILGVSYPLRRGIRRLSKQCLKDQGAQSVFYYFETKIDVEDAFERIYNLNTSRLKQKVNEEKKLKGIKEDHEEKETRKVIRAIDHNDFSFHSTETPIRWRLWKLYRTLTGKELEYAMKVSFTVIFLSIPAWLASSWRWFTQYNCFWGAFLLYFFLSPRNSCTWKNLCTRIIQWFIGAFWGWAANQSRHFKNPIVIGAFAGLFCFPYAFEFLVRSHPRSSIVALVTFTVTTMNVYVNASDSSFSVFQHTWPVSVSILISVIASAFINWIVWPFSAKDEVYISCSSLMSHIGQSYQSVAERYLYRDEDDDPTDLTLELANIREVRMSQSLYAIKELLEKAKLEHDFTHSFNGPAFDKFLDSCYLILEKIIEARISGIYFHIWEQDKDEQTTKALLSIRRDSVATVVYILYILSNSFATRTGLPAYLPSAIGIRKRLYDIIAELEEKRSERMNEDDIAEQLSRRLAAMEATAHGSSEYSKSHWTEIHGMAFARAFTAITGELENLILLAKEILGEDRIF